MSHDSSTFTTTLLSFKKKETVYLVEKQPVRSSRQPCLLPALPVFTAEWVSAEADVGSSVLHGPSNFFIRSDTRTFFFFNFEALHCENSLKNMLHLWLRTSGFSRRINKLQDVFRKLSGDHSCPVGKKRAELNSM